MSTRRAKKVDLDNNNHTSSPTNKSREKKSGKRGNDEIMKNGKTAAVLVVGDAGRSPRMQYHTLSLANIAGMERVYLVGFSGNYYRYKYTYLQFDQYEYFTMVPNVYIYILVEWILNPFALLITFVTFFQLLLLLLLLLLILLSLSL